MTARLATAGDLPALAEIWNVSFPGDEAFSQWFLENVFAPENALVWEEGGRAAGMLHLLPMRCQVSGQPVQAAYIFAVAVKPQHRGLGVAAGLLEEALRLSRERGAAL
ncbi:MAG TPA: GNAT family N-acetyltransferase, partial [Clostridia bacterium]|nr:GNAT family N-acetyltransferase [Clostridia bacterium]